MTAPGLRRARILFSALALVATNGVASLAAVDDARARRFVDALWNLEVPKSRTFRYYDGLLYMMSLPHASGRSRSSSRRDDARGSEREHWVFRVGECSIGRVVR